MYELVTYRDRNGRDLIADYLRDLFARQDKNSRIKREKIHDYMNILREMGKAAGVPYVKHLDGEIWELRPLSDRILFAAWVDGKIVLLHHFVKKTQKTPRREIEQAERELADFMRRSKDYE